VLDPQIRVGIADPRASILEEFDISYTDAGFQDFLHRIDHHEQELDLSGGSSYVGIQWVCTSRTRFLDARDLSCML